MRRLRSFAPGLILVAALMAMAVACADIAQTMSDRHRISAAQVLTSPTPPPEPSISVDDLLALHRALVSDDFSRLESRLLLHLDSARLDTGYEPRFRTAFGVFLTGDSSVRPHLDEWVARYPRSSAAHLARTAHFSAVGDDARGTTWARETSDAQFLEMRI